VSANAYRRLLQEGALVVMTPEAPAGDAALQHKPVLVTIMQLDGDVTTKVAGDHLTHELLRAHFRSLDDLQVQLTSETAAAAKLIQQLILGVRLTLSGAGAAGGLGGTTALDLPLGGDLAVIAGAAAVFIAPHLEVGKRLISTLIGKAAKWIFKAGSGWATGTITAR
jgi:hypothetical protein